MPIIGNFPGGSGGSGGGGLVLASVTGIKALSAAGKVYVKWTDPDDLVVAGSALATWGGTILVRKAGSAPVSRRDGTVVLDSKTRNAYMDTYFCDSGLTDGVQYFYKFFPYTTSGGYTDSPDAVFNATPNPVPLGNVSGMSAVAAGNGKLAIKYADPAATIVTDSITMATWAKTVVVVKEGSYATDPDDADAAFRQVVTTRNQYATTALTATGLKNGTTYYVSFFPVSTDDAINTNTANRVSGVADRMEITVAPKQSGTLTYNKAAQTPSWDSGYDSTKMTMSATAQTNVGTYTGYATPKDDYKWAASLVVSGMVDNLAAKPITWKINQATGTLTLTPSSLTLNKDALTGDFTIGGDFDGTYSVVSQDTSVATVALKSGKTYTVSSVSNTTGKTTIKVTCTGGINYTNPAEKSVEITAQFLPAVGTALNDCSWDDIKQISDAGQGTNYWKVGDTKTIKINGKVGAYTFSNVSVDAYILGFDHNSAKEGTNRIHFQLAKTAVSGGTDVALCDSSYNSTGSSAAFRMNTSNTNAGGWAGSYMKKTICPAFESVVPSDLRSNLKTVTKHTDNTGNASTAQANVTATTEKFFPLAEYEVFGTITYANTYEANKQAQYDYYKAGNSKIKYRHDATTTAVFWWLRSPRRSNSTYFVNVNTGGTVGSAYAGRSLAFAPGFDL